MADHQNVPCNQIRCILCSKVFVNSKLGSHILNCHPFFRCNTCPYVTRNHRNFLRHLIKKFCCKKPLYTCEWQELCGIQSHLQRSQTKHRNIHDVYVGRSLSNGRSFSASFKNGTLYARPGLTNFGVMNQQLNNIPASQDNSKNIYYPEIPGPSDSDLMHPQSNNIPVNQDNSSYIYYREIQDPGDSGQEQPESKNFSRYNPSPSDEFIFGISDPNYFGQRQPESNNFSPLKSSSSNSIQLDRESEGKEVIALDWGLAVNSRTTLERKTPLERSSLPGETGVSTLLGTTQAETLLHFDIDGSNPPPVQIENLSDLNYPMETPPKNGTQKEKGTFFLINPHIDPCLGSSVNSKLFTIMKWCVIESEKNYASKRGDSFPSDPFHDLDYAVEETFDFLTEHRLTGNPFSNNPSFDPGFGSSEDIEVLEDMDSDETLQPSNGDLLSKIAEML